MNTNATDSRESASIVTAMREFMQLESAGGVLLLITAVAAILIANSPLAGLYEALLDTTAEVRIGAFEIDKPLLLWINDGLMAIFFFLIGLEVKREFMEGELSSPALVVLPAVGALGGMLIPALLYVWINQGDAIALKGWAIPVATDIAFALALLGAFAARVPTALKVFLLTLAIFDDLAAIVIIAIFYSGNLSLTSLSIGAAGLAVAVGMNRLGVTKKAAYMLLGIVVWAAVLKSGVHATLAGVLIAFCIPMRDAAGGSPLRELEHDLHGPVAFAILPAFAFANAGVSLTGISAADVLHPITTGIALGLVAGKPVGILLFVGLAVLLRLAKLPDGVTWPQLTGVACACGIGFTMSLFIAGLAFELAGGDFAGDRLGIIIGSILSAATAALILKVALPREPGARQQ